MLNFAIIAEGATDQIVIRNILLGYFQGDEEPNVTAIQPEPPTAANPAPHAGWTLVLESLRSGDIRDVLQIPNTIVIIHIDTDVQEEKGYDVPRRDGSRELAAEERIERVRRRLLAEMQPPIHCADAARVLFAIAVDSIECWLLPLLVDKKKATKDTGCLDVANKALRKKDRDGLGSDAKKFPEAYDDASDEYTKRATLLAKGPLNVSLGVFLNELEALQKRLPASPDV